MAKNLLMLNGKLSDDEWEWLAMLVSWSPHYFGNPLQREGRPLINKDPTEITRNELLLLDKNKVWELAQKSIAYQIVRRSERSVFEKLKRLVNEGQNTRRVAKTKPKGSTASR